jgi:hypothetical protein
VFCSASAHLQSMRHIKSVTENFINNIPRRLYHVRKIIRNNGRTAEGRFSIVQNSNTIFFVGESVVLQVRNLCKSEFSTGWGFKCFLFQLISKLNSKLRINYQIKQLK